MLRVNLQCDFSIIISSPRVYSFLSDCSLSSYFSLVDKYLIIIKETMVSYSANQTPVSNCNQANDQAVFEADKRAVYK